jgi:hypothetical protein
MASAGGAMAHTAPTRFVLRGAASDLPRFDRATFPAARPPRRSSSSIRDEGER